MSDTATATPATTKTAFQVQAEAQVVEDQTAFDAAKAAAASAHAAKVKADSDAYDALQKASDASPSDPALVAEAVLLQTAAAEATKVEESANADLVAARDKLEASKKKAAGTAVSSKSPWFYDASAKQASADFLDPSRFFQWEPPADNPNACPERDGVQVNAIPVSAKGAFPKAIQEVAARVAQK